MPKSARSGHKSLPSRRWPPSASAPQTVLVRLLRSAILFAPPPAPDGQRRLKRPGSIEEGLADAHAGLGEKSGRGPRSHLWSTLATMTVRYARPAARRLAEIVAELRVQNPFAIRGLSIRLGPCLRRISTFPLVLLAVPKFPHSPIREFFIPRYRFFYFVDEPEDGVDISVAQCNFHSNRAYRPLTDARRPRLLPKFPILPDLKSASARDLGIDSVSSGAIPGPVGQPYHDDSECSRPYVGTHNYLQ